MCIPCTRSIILGKRSNRGGTETMLKMYIDHIRINTPMLLCRSRASKVSMRTILLRYTRHVSVLKRSTWACSACSTRPRRTHAVAPPHTPHHAMLDEMLVVATHPPLSDARCSICRPFFIVRTARDRSPLERRVAC